MTSPPPDSSARSPEAALRMQPRRRIAFAATGDVVQTEQAARPGFALVDDAGGRFTVDPEFGVISLADDAWLEREAGSVHAVTLRVVEPTGAQYDQRLKLRLTGRVPQVDGSNELAALVGMTGDAAPTPKPLPAAAWAQFAAPHGVRRKCPLCGEAAPYGALIAPPLPQQTRAASAMLDFPHRLPRPAPRGAAWPV